MTFELALTYLKEGKKIKREHWGGYWFYNLVEVLEPVGEEAVKGKFEYMIVAKLADGGYAPAQAYQEDLLSSDWEVVE
jgi:hypothetical protein